MGLLITGINNKKIREITTDLELQNVYVRLDAKIGVTNVLISSPYTYFNKNKYTQGIQNTIRTDIFLRGYYEVILETTNTTLEVLEKVSQQIILDNTVDGIPQYSIEIVDMD